MTTEQLYNLLDGLATENILNLIERETKHATDRGNTGKDKTFLVVLMQIYNRRYLETQIGKEALQNELKQVQNIAEQIKKINEQ